MIKYSVELYFFKEESKNNKLSDIPDLDKYKTETIMEYVEAPNWERAKKIILDKYQNLAYMYVHYTRNLDT